MNRSGSCNTEFTNNDKHAVIKARLELSAEQLQAIFGRQVAYNKFLAIAGGSVGAGVFLSQLLHWMEYLKPDDGWIYKTAKDWWQETALSQHELHTIRKALIARKILDEKRCGVPAKLYYRLNWDQLKTALAVAIDDHAAGVNKREAPKNKFSATRENKSSASPESINEIEDKNKNG